MATGLVDKPRLPEAPAGGAARTLRRGRRRAWLAAERAVGEGDLYDGLGLGAGARLAGPALVELPLTTVVVPPEWRLETDRHGSFVLEPA